MSKVSKVRAGDVVLWDNHATMHYATDGTRGGLLPVLKAQGASEYQLSLAGLPGAGGVLGRVLT